MTTTLDPLVSVAEIADLERDGVVLLKDRVDSAWQARLCQAVERSLAKSERYFWRYMNWQEDPDFNAFCQRSNLPAIAAALQHSDRANLLYDQVFVKEPGSASATGWHNDQPYWPVEGWDVVSLWVALDPVTTDNGALEFIRGSHKWDRWFEPFIANEKGGYGHVVPAKDPRHEPLPDFDAERDRHEILSFPMAPGDVLAFHGLIVHGAQANVSTTRRRGYAVRYTGDRARYAPGVATNDFLMNPDLKPGDPMDSALFPLVYSR